MIAEVIAGVPVDPNGAPRHPIRHPATLTATEARALAGLLIDAVDGGASVSCTHGGLCDTTYLHRDLTR